jgi:hypothetical protein
MRLRKVGELDYHHIVDPRRVRFVGGSAIFPLELNNSNNSAAPMSVCVGPVLPVLSMPIMRSLSTAPAVRGRVTISPSQ